jgi:chromosome segregation ATPase
VRRILYGLIGVLVLLFVAPVQAQESRFVVVDEPGALDRERIEEAAQPLLERGATVAIYLVLDGSADDDVDQRLAAAGLLNNGILDDDLVGVYVSIEPPTSQIIVGDRWAGALSSETLNEIQANELNAQLAAGDFSGAYAETLTALDVSIAGPNIWPVVLGVLGVLALGAGGFALFRARSAAQQQDSARQRADDARKAAGAAIVEAGRLLDSAREKSQYDRVSYDAEDVEQMAETQRAIEQQFAAVQQQFDRAENDLSQRADSDAAAYEQAATEFAQVQQAADEVTADLEQLAAQRAELDTLAQRASTELERARQDLADLRDELSRHSSDITDAAAMLAPVQQQLSAAEQASASNQPRATLQAAGQAHDLVQLVLALLGSLTTIRANIVRGRNEAEHYAAQGYRMEESSTSRNRAEQALAEAVRQMQGGSAASLRRADQQIEQAQAALDRASATGAERVKLRATNEQRLAELEERARGVDAAIERGAIAFDQVDDFAESTWSDIRGNGSAAEAAARQAGQHLLTARQRNTMERQQFEQAGAALDAAQRGFERALGLVQAIEQRLSELQEARSAARDELDAAAADIARGRAFIQKHDPDIGTVPEQTLERSEEALQQAQAMAEQPHPDWLELVRTAQRANALADEALAQARAEVETATKLRQSVRRAAQVATSGLQRAERFLTAQINDISLSNRQAVQELQQRARGEDGVLKSPTFDSLPLNKLKAMQQTYTQLGEEAERLYQAMQQEQQAAAAARERRRREAQARRGSDILLGTVLGAGGVLAGSRRQGRRTSGGRGPSWGGSSRRSSGSSGGGGSRSRRSSWGGGSRSRRSRGGGSRSKRRGW